MKNANFSLKLALILISCLFLLLSCSEETDVGEVTGRVIADGQAEAESEDIKSVDADNIGAPESEPETLSDGDTGNAESGEEENIEISTEVHDVQKDDFVLPANRGETHTVDLIEYGFEVSKLNIKAGDTVVWQNVRDGRMRKAMIVGANSCKSIKSGIFEPGEVFIWKFEKAGNCLIVDGIFTTQTMQIIVE